MQQSQHDLYPSQTGQSRFSEGIQDPWDLPLAAADQACKECRRRKAKCNKGIPTCNLCLKYNRHCLYEKHSRTPLTRKHLTEVEARLERAEALLRQARLIPQARAIQEPFPPPESRPVSSGSTDLFDFCSLNEPLPTKTSAPLLEDHILAGQHGFDISSHVGQWNSPTQTSTLALKPAESPLNHTEDASNPLEPPPMDDFEWDEQDVGVIESPGSKSGDDLDVIDGMAALTMNDRQGGYLGVASGAAFLRIMSPVPTSYRRELHMEQESVDPAKLIAQPDPNRHVLDNMIDSYFRLYHFSYPIIHEPTFRAQYSQIVPRPNGKCWKVLAYVVAAIGVWTTSTSLTDLDIALFAEAKSALRIDFLEAGNLTLVQALTLSSNYQQKRNKPNSGYNYLGLAVRMAMGLGLHKEFQGWNISPLKMEIRRRVWWSLYCFDIGGTITFSRPMTWPVEGVEVSFPLNIHDKDLTETSTKLPGPVEEITPYTAARIQSSFHNATNVIYRRVISKPLPTAASLLDLDSSLIDPWLSTLPSYFTNSASIPPEYRVAQAVDLWRYPNLRIIMYRPFVIRRALHASQGREHTSATDDRAYEKCLEAAQSTITDIAAFWADAEHTRMGAWYALYFLFQAALIPCICLRNSPDSPLSASWRDQITLTLSTIQAMTHVNSSAPRCSQVILGLCGQFLSPNINPNPIAARSPSAPPTEQVLFPTEESPQTQMNNVYSMMWPNVPALEADVVMQDDAWMEFLMGQDEGYGLDWYNASSPS